jgi:hypothetical protein
MIMEGSKQSVAEQLARCQSSLVRRLVKCSEDPAKESVRRSLCDVDDERLLDFGLTPDDIDVLRTCRPDHA